MSYIFFLYTVSPLCRYRDYIIFKKIFFKFKVIASLFKKYKEINILIISLFTEIILIIE